MLVGFTKDNMNKDDWEAITTLSRADKLLIAKYWENELHPALIGMVLFLNTWFF